MAKQIPQCEPAEGYINSAWSWDIYYGDFPSDDGWSLNYYLSGPSILTLAWATEVTAAASGGGFEVRVPAATTNGIGTAGGHRLRGRVSKAGDDFDGELVYNKHLLVLPDPVDAVAAKSVNRQRLEALQTAVLAQGTKDIVHRVITVNGRTVEYSDEQYEKLLAKYMGLVALEENPHGSLTHATEYVRG